MRQHCFTVHMWLESQKGENVWLDRKKCEEIMAAPFPYQEVQQTSKKINVAKIQTGASYWNCWCLNIKRNI